METENNLMTQHDSSSGLTRQRSSRRLRHEAQAKVFEKQSGSLDELRLRLGLRPSQICELLRVHPSAWTRWTRTGRAPPHVFQMLEWYTELLQWRGQYRSPKEAVLQALNQENPAIYVPSDPPLPTAFVNPVKIARPSRLMRIMIGVWILQAVLWGVALMMMAKKF